MKQTMVTILINYLLFYSLIFCYKFGITDSFDYMGFADEFKLYKFIIINLLIIFVLLLSITMEWNLLKISYYTITVLFLYGESIYYIFTNDSTVNVLVGILVMLFILWGFSLIKVKIENRIIVKSNMKMMTIISVIMFLPFLRYVPYWDIKNLFLIDVYETRFKFRQLLSEYIEYIRAPLSRILLPVLILYSILTKNFKVLTLGILLILGIYLTGALKSVFLGLIAILIFYKGSYYVKQIMFSLGFLLLSFMGTIIYQISNNTFFIDLFIRRIFFTPSYLNNIYVNNFADNYTYYSHSGLSFGLLNNDYSKSLSLYVGENILNEPGLNANVGVITEGYISYGFIGMLLSGLFIAFVLFYFNSLKINHRFYGIIFVYIYYFNTSFISTLLLTHGLLFFMIFAYIFLNDTERSMIKRRTSYE